MFELPSGDTFEFAGYEGVYMGKNDGLMEIEHMLLSLQRHDYPPTPDMLASVVGSLAVIDMVRASRPWPRHKRGGPQLAKRPRTLAGLPIHTGTRTEG